VHHTVKFSVNALGYVPVLSKPNVSDRSHHRSLIKGNVTASARSRTITLTVQGLRRG
jgi:hypothetical protein